MVVIASLELPLAEEYLYGILALLWVIKNVKAKNAMIVFLIVSKTFPAMNLNIVRLGSFK
jgi:hypothetical protein